MGAIAALLTASCWAFSSIVFTFGSKQVGSLTANRLRLLIAAVLLVLTHWIFIGQVFPIGASADRWLWLGLSGVVGLMLGDLSLFQSLVMVGPRLAMLLMSFSPVISTLLAWIFLSEALSFTEIAGILLCVAGIAWVVMEQQDNDGVVRNKKNYILGILCGLGGATGQAVGLILAKKGLYGDFSPLSAVVIRMTVATLLIWILAFLMRQGLTSLRAIKNPPAMRSIFVGALIGSYVGIWLSLIAVQETFVGIASTLMALTPVIMLPIARWFYKERISNRAIFGTTTAMAGIALIFMFS
jgi:drug/metabolite transporter (DMT)-like permease